MDENRKKRNFIKVFVNDATREEIQTKATIAAMPLSKYLRTTGLQEEIKPPIPLDIRKNIAGWSRLFNQCAAVANTNGELPLQMVKDLQEKAAEIIKLIRKAGR